MKTIKTVDKHIGNVILPNKPTPLKNSKVSNIVLANTPTPVKSY